MSSVASVCLCVCPVRVRTFESLSLEAPFLAGGYTSSEHLDHVRISRSSGHGQDHGSKNVKRA